MASGAWEVVLCGSRGDSLGELRALAGVALAHETWKMSFKRSVGSRHGRYERLTAQR
jgi:hypothetical protein